MGKKRSTLFRFDVALSFARQDRPRAECVARAMQSLGLRVFYDKDHHADLWGKNRTAFDQIYGPDSAYFVPLISKHYSQREWTQYEFETAKREARIRSKEFILPLRVDNARQFGLTDDHNFLSLKEFTPEEVAAALRKKLNSDYMTRKPHSKRAANARILTLQSREALGLIVTAPIPMSFAHLRDFFPAIDWEKHLREFRADNLISADSTLFTPTKGVGKFFEEEFTSLQSKWAARLEELSGHVDCAYFLSLHYLKKRSLDDAVLTLANVAESMEPGYWVGLYVAAFDAMDNAKFLRKLKPEIRLAFHQAYGHCLAAIGRLEEARSQYGKLQHIGRKLGDTESLGLVLMNVGVTYHKSGDVASAKTWYERARSFGVDHKQPMLIANTIHNLGQLEVESDPQNAVRMLEESIQYKRENDDDYGIAASLQVIATAYAEMEDFQESLAYYDRAEVIIDDLDLQHQRAHLLSNKGNTLLQMGKNSEALRSFTKALKIANEESFAELQVRATEGISRIHFDASRLIEAESAMQDLLRLAKSASMPEYMMIAHHGLWAVYALRENTKVAAQHFTKLVRLARKQKSDEWLVRAFVDRSKPVCDGKFQSADPKVLARFIRAESRRNDAIVTGSLWFQMAQILEGDVDKTIQALEKCIECFSTQAELIDDALDVHEFLYELQWDAGRIEDAIATLDKISRVAQIHRKKDRELAAIDQKGSCLQELERYPAALSLHQRAAKQAQTFKLECQAVTSLHNIAECYRCCGESSLAIKYFDQAKVVAKKLDDAESSIQIDHGKALSLESLGQFNAASDLFEVCRRDSKKTQCWSEYVHALEAVANLSWSGGRRNVALKHYESAMAACIQYDILEAMPQIAFNRARLLRLLGKAREARQLLARHIDSVVDPTLVSDWHSTLAELCAETGRLVDARKHWQAAIDSAGKHGDDDDLTYCRQRFADFERLHNTPRTSIAALKQTLAGRLSHKDRAEAQIQLLKKYFHRKSDRLATETFEIAQTHMQKYKLHSYMIDTYMLLFHYNWEGDRNSRLQSLKAYVAAFAEAVGDDESEESMDKIFVPVIRKLTEQANSPSMKEVKWLQDQFTNWLTQELGNDTESINALSLPLQYAVRLIPFNKDPIRMLAEHEKMAAEFDDELD